MSNEADTCRKFVVPKLLAAGYTGIPTNLLFFDRSGPTREVW
jgi:type I restriction enzyme M protein